MNLERAGALAGHIENWLAWAEENHGEEFVYISGDLIQDLANYLVIMEETE